MPGLSVQHAPQLLASAHSSAGCRSNAAHRPRLEAHGKHHAAPSLAVLQRHLHILGALGLDKRAAQVGVLDLDLGQVGKVE